MLLKKVETGLLRRLTSIKHIIGNTPLYPISRVFQRPNVRVFAKLEWHQIGGSVKARPAFNIISKAVESGMLRRNNWLLDASSGNTALAYAALGAALNLKVTICLPKNAAAETKRLLKVFRAELIQTSSFGSTDEAQDVAEELNNRNPEKYYYANQYGNDNNWKAHYNGTAMEIWEQTKGAITHFVTGLGTTGSFVGVSRKLKEMKPGVKTIALQPQTALHGLEGWKHLETVRIPTIHDPMLADDNYVVETEEAYYWVKEVAKYEGLLISPSSAANLVGAMKVAENVKKGVIVTLFPDNGERYKEVMEDIF